MRTVTRRGLLAGAMTVLTSLAGAAPVFADHVDGGHSIPVAESDSGSIRIRAESPEQTSADGSGLSVAVRIDDDVTAGELQLGAGQSIAEFALAYVGYPYVAGGNSPYGFDCSGFTQFVYLNMLGIDIGHGVENQPWSGAWVEWGAWISGDLIVFQNTYQAGISHVGIYIGDGLIVHAENDSTGVTISSIYSEYYIARYWGAVRLI